MRVISLVPSITETLIECGVNVVGRTRFCIHPSAQVDKVSVVGGTKGVDWQRCRALKPDLVVFDREENLRQMAVECPFPWVATQVTSVGDCAGEFELLANKLESEALLAHAHHWRELDKKPALQQVDWGAVPGQLATLQQQQDVYQRVEYLIWRDPWMAIGPQTFIASVMNKLGFAGCLSPHQENYPILDDAQLAARNTFYLFSSEPFRFLRYQDQLRNAGYNGAIVDGEVYSWFGIRSLRALQAYLLT